MNARNRGAILQGNANSGAESSRDTLAINWSDGMFAAFSWLCCDGSGGIMDVSFEQSGLLQVTPKGTAVPDQGRTDTLDPGSLNPANRNRQHVLVVS